MIKDLTPLEALNEIAYSYGYDKNIEIIEKPLKALEIIKSKCEFVFIKQEIVGQPTRYEIRIMPINEEQLFFTCLAIFAKDQEEYDLLKETLL